MTDTNQEQSGVIKTEDVSFGTSTDSTNDTQEKKPERILVRNLDDFFTFEVSVTVPYSDAADANYYPIFYVANVQCFLIEAKYRHGTAGGANAAVDVEKLASGTARGSGVSMITSTFDLTATADTTQSKTPSTTLANFQLSPGDAVALKATGTLTNARHVCVTLLFGILAKDIPTSANV